jgi:hypothetical protein
MNYTEQLKSTLYRIGINDPSSKETFNPEEKGKDDQYYYDLRNDLVSDAVYFAKKAGIKAGYLIHTPVTDIIEKGWDYRWGVVAYIELPTGQISYVNSGNSITFDLVYQSNYGEHQKGDFIGTYKLSEVDRDLADLTWFRNGVGYLKRQDHLPKPNGYLHRIVAERMFGEIPDGYEVDHINRDTMDYTRGNLRLATSHAQKLNQNRAGTSVKQRANGRWQALCQINGKQRSLGMSDTKEQALKLTSNFLQEQLADAHENGEFIYATHQVSWHIESPDIQYDGHGYQEKKDRIASFIEG